MTNFVQLLGQWVWVKLHQTYVGAWAQTAAEASQRAQTQDKTERGEHRPSVSPLKQINVLHITGL